MSDLLPPPGYRARPANLADVSEIHRLVTACEQALHGRAEADADRIAAELSRPGLDPAADSILVYAPPGDLAGWAWVDRRCVVDVHPGHHGRGIGAFLLTWACRRARARGTTRLTQTVPDADRAAAALLRDRGFTPLVSEWLLGIDLAGEPQVPTPPAGVTVRPFRAGDETSVYQLVEDAFAEWQPRRHTYDEWARLTVRRTSFAAELSPLAFAGDALVGAVLSLDGSDHDGDGYVERVAVRRDHRHRGIARLLLRYAFRAGHQRGQRRVMLATHSDTGALALYERVGMRVRRSSTVYACDVAD
ncbi:GNAT family N-acetyltransferase [Plantactinospora sp. GCM10030261]|uniref:GNAT family N-acetyltransferase n=1 Tax=Plantactinospora sp. GCM10030261 TaxID=3273420 RepID=UPI00360822DD